MNSHLVVVTPRVRPAVTLVEAKAHLRVDTADEDALITGWIAAATGHAERFMGRTLVDTTYDLVFDAFPPGRKPFVVPMPPLIEVIGAYAVDGEDEVEIGGYVTDTAGGRILAPAAGWPAARESGFRIRFRAGYVRQDDASPPNVTGEVPRDIWAALLLYIGSFHLQREHVTPNAMAVVPWGAEQLLRMHRVERSMA